MGLSDFLSDLTKCLNKVVGWFGNSQPDPNVSLRRRAEQGDVSAQFELGTIYSEGLGLPQNQAIALKWYLLAAEKGHAQAHRTIGSCYMGCLGVPQDPVEGANWWRKAAELGDIKANTLMGICYESAIGVPQNKSMAMYWYRRAAEKGDASAQASLGGCYIFSDLTEAYAWFGISVVNGNKDAIELLNKVTRDLSILELDKAKARYQQLLGEFNSRNE
jgi:TPR repeat protein